MPYKTNRSPIASASLIGAVVSRRQRRADRIEVFQYLLAQAMSWCIKGGLELL